MEKLYFCLPEVSIWMIHSVLLELESSARRLNIVLQLHFSKCKKFLLGLVLSCECIACFSRVISSTIKVCRGRECDCKLANGSYGRRVARASFSYAMKLFSIDKLLINNTAVLSPSR